MKPFVVDPLERFAARRDRGRALEIATPEGLRVGFRLAPVGDRAVAFLLDLLRIALFVLLLGVLVLGGILLFGIRDGAAWFGAAALVAFFFLRNFYFAWYELRNQGVTPGKRRIGLRVVDARGRPLRGAALLARNLTRELELFLPLLVLGSAAEGGSEGPLLLLASLWLLVPSLLPLCDPLRRRAGDWLAGTLVVLQPETLLLQDLGRIDRERVRTADALVSFTPQQLDAYGIYEVQVLEELLREAKQKPRKEVLRAVAEQVARKIGWSAPVRDPHEFLRAFYAAERAHLERKLLLGQRKERKSER